MKNNLKIDKNSYGHFRADELQHVDSPFRARIAKDEIAVRYSARADVGREFLEIDVPNGWDDVKSIHTRVLIYENKRFIFTGWNSDSLKAYFARPFGAEPEIAKIAK